MSITDLFKYAETHHFRWYQDKNKVTLVKSFKSSKGSHDLIEIWEFIPNIQRWLIASLEVV